MRRVTASVDHNRRNRLVLAFCWLEVLMVCALGFLSLGGVKGQELNPNVAYMGDHGTLVIWQLPSDTVRKVLLIAHPYQSGPETFWDQHSNCPQCVGLPEERIIVRNALSKNYAVVAVSAIDQNRGWNAWPQDSSDVNNVVSILSTLTGKYGLQHVPKVGLGISLGGCLISTLALRPGFFESVVVMISRGTQQAWGSSNSAYPPTLLMNMPRDKFTASALPGILNKLHSNGVPAAQVQWYPVPVTPDWFAQRIPGLDYQTSSAIQQAFKEAGALDHKDIVSVSLSPGALGDNYDWHRILSRVLPRDMNGQLNFERQVLEEKSVAQALHATFSLKNNEMFHWFEYHSL